MASNDTVNSAVLLSANEEAIVVGARFTAQLLSLIGSLAILISLIYFKRVHQMSSRLILYLTCANLGESITSVIFLYIVWNNEEAHKATCYAQGLFLQFFQTAAYLWTTIIAVNLYFVVVRKRYHVSRYEKWYIVAVAIPLAVFTILPMTTSAYGIGAQNYWCWISSDKNHGTLWRFVAFYIPLYLCITAVIVLYSLIYYTVKKRTEDDPGHESQAKRTLRRLRAYPIAFILLWVLPTANRIENWISEHDVFFLFLLGGFSASIIGFVNAIIYGLDYDMRRRYHYFIVTKMPALESIFGEPPILGDSEDEEAEPNVVITRESDEWAVDLNSSQDLGDSISLST